MLEDLPNVNLSLVVLIILAVLFLMNCWLLNHSNRITRLEHPKTYADILKSLQPKRDVLGRFVK